MPFQNISDVKEKLIPKNIIYVLKNLFQKFHSTNLFRDVFHIFQKFYSKNIISNFFFWNSILEISFHKSCSKNS